MMGILPKGFWEAYEKDLDPPEVFLGLSFPDFGWASFIMLVLGVVLIIGGLSFSFIPVWMGWIFYFTWVVMAIWLAIWSRQYMKTRKESEQE